MTCLFALAKTSHFFKIFLNFRLFFPYNYYHKKIIFLCIIQILISPGISESPFLI